ncbi:MAG: hypothetical protein R3B90_01530 [Planctomycetaceae bacterium]
MFDSEFSTPDGWACSRWTIGSLAGLSLLSLVVTIGILTDVQHEQRLVEKLTSRLPASSQPDADELAGDPAAAFD